MTETMERARSRMISKDLEGRGIRDRGVLRAMADLPREHFVRDLAGLSPEDVYQDAAIPLGRGQTLSQPYIVATMTEALEATDSDRVLEIGTGSGYQTAVLAGLAGEVWTVERDPVLAEEAHARLDDLGIDNVRFLIGDGTKGWPEGAPYDAILVTAGSPGVPAALSKQLAPGGRLVVPVGSREIQRLLRIRHSGTGEEQSSEVLMECRFVPLVGEEGWSPGWMERRRARRPS